MAYGMGAVAPILYTGAVMQADVPHSLSDPFMSLPYHLYILVNNGFSLDYALWNRICTDALPTHHPVNM